MTRRSRIALLVASGSILSRRSSTAGGFLNVGAYQGRLQPGTLRMGNLNMPQAPEVRTGDIADDLIVCLYYGRQ